MQKEKAEPLPKEVDVENSFKASYISRKIKDPVQFCVDHSTFPILAYFAIDPLASFASAAMITSGRCNQHTDHNIERQVFLQTNQAELKVKTTIFVYQ